MFNILAHQLNDLEIQIGQVPVTSTRQLRTLDPDL